MPTTKPDTKTAHTPGPWTTREATASTPTVHLTGPHGHIASFTGKNRVADAALSAAAPELQTALEDLRDWLVNLFDASKLNSEDRAKLERAEAALAKSEGRP